MKSKIKFILQNISEAQSDASESFGRSMVEMLGVLAIVGILSAGALKGYSDAMFKHKMNQTIDIATKMFQRFEEINAKNWGTTGDDMVWFSGGSDMVELGMLEKCTPDTNGWCRLPIGSLMVELYEDLTDAEGCGITETGHFGEFTFKFTNVKSCIAFASVHWEQMLPVEWWNPNGLIGIDWGDVYLYSPKNGITHLTNSEIATLCEQQCADGECNIYFRYREFC